MLKVIGDKIVYKGWTVAEISNEVPATVRDEFEVRIGRANRFAEIKERLDWFTAKIEAAARPMADYEELPPAS